MFDWVHEMSGSGEAASTQKWDDHSRTVLSAGKKKKKKKVRQQMAVRQTAGEKTPILACRLYWAAASSPRRL